MLRDSKFVEWIEHETYGDLGETRKKISKPLRVEKISISSVNDSAVTL